MKNLYKVIMVLLIFMLFIPQVLEFLYWCEGWFFTRVNFSKGELLGFYGNYIAFFGTVFLGYIALSQNVVAFKVNRNLQIQQLSIMELERNRVEIDSIRDAISKTILSFNIGVFRFTINNREFLDFSTLLKELEESQKSAYCSSVNLELLNYFNTCKAECDSCQKNCEVKKCSAVFREKLIDFKEFHLLYSRKYIELSEACLQIMYKHNYINRIETVYKESLNEISVLCQSAERDFSRNIQKIQEALSIADTPETRELYEKQVNTMCETYQTNQAILMDNLAKLNALIAIKEPTKTSIENAIKPLLDDIAWIQNAGYNELKYKAYAFLEQCKFEKTQQYEKLMLDKEKN